MPKVSHKPATKAISYLRYSSREQAKGGSEQRQAEWTEEYCEQKKLELVDTYKDLGISAHRGKHSQKGKLASLLKDCQSGKIPKGYALIIENFDRLSREEVPIALQRVLMLINDYRLEIHTLDDNRIYIPGKVDITELLISIIIMGRAHSESARKSVFVGKAWKQVREAGKAYSRPGKQPLGRIPNWLDWNSDKQDWILDAGAVSTIKYIFTLATEHGLGRYAIAQRLQAEEIPVFSKRATKWTAAMVKRISNNRSLLGEFIPANSKDKTAKTIHDYYPRIIEDTLFEKCQRAFDSRNSHLNGRPTVKTHQHSILTGIGYYLGARVHKGYYKTRKSKEVKSTYAVMKDNKNTYLGYADYIEWFICSIISELDKTDLSAKAKNSKLQTQIETQISNKRNEQTDLEKIKRNLLTAIGMDDGSIPELVQEMQSTKHDVSVLKYEIEELEQQLSDLVTGSGLHDREAVTKLKKAALDDKTLQARQDIQVKLQQLIKRLDLGKHPDDLPDCKNDFYMHALTLHAVSPVKFWAKIELFNGIIVLGSMTADGQIARLRFEDH